MDEDCFREATKYVSKTYIDQAVESRKSLSKDFRILLSQRKLPKEGWSDSAIETLINEFSSMDSNNFEDNCGVGEREGRIYSKLVQNRHFRLGHGIGRSGDIAEVQPKAAGSSLLNKMTNSLVLDVIRLAGGNQVKSCFVVPMATGMALVLCMLAIRQKRPQAKYVLWPRIDQKSCFKSISTAGYQAVVIENQLVGDELRTDVQELTDKILELGAENIACVLSTTSCFAPRVPDSLDIIAELCKKNDIPHIVNNAYGIQLSKCMHLIQKAHQVGRLDAFVQSTDKNFMVPVGGAIIAGYDEDFINHIRKTYPGRASSTPSVDMFITLLSLGQSGYKKLLKDRKEVMEYLRSKLNEVAEKHGEKLLSTKNNPISMGMTLSKFSADERKNITEIGSMLFRRCISGTRVIAHGDNKEICGHSFINWGSHHDNYPWPYLTVAAAIGVTHDDCDKFVKRLDGVLAKKLAKSAENISNGNA